MEQIIKEIFGYLLMRLGDVRLYLVGGSSRDYLLGLDFDDFDFATDLTPDRILAKFSEADRSFARYGTIGLKYKSYSVTLATFRLESGYEDSRHPNDVLFIDDLYLDSRRRDFTINAIYIDRYLKILDPQNGMADLKDRRIRMIGNISQRIEEDPLRIARAYRFASKLGFSLDRPLAEFIQTHGYLLRRLRPAKLESELAKCTPEAKQKILGLMRTSLPC